ncbi:MAG: ATP-binding protein [Vulcanimicrobiota bacterium]
MKEQNLQTILNDYLQDNSSHENLFQSPEIIDMLAAGNLLSNPVFFSNLNPSDKNNSKIIEKTLHLIKSLAARIKQDKESRQEEIESYKEKCRNLENYIKEVENTSRLMGKQNLVLSYFYQASQMISSSLNFKYIIRSIVEMLANIFGDCFCCLLDVDENGKLQASPSNPQSIAKFTEFFNNNIDMEVGQGCEGACIEEQVPFQITDVNEDPQYKPFLKLAQEFNYQAVLSVPMIIRGNVEGCISIYSYQKRFFPEEDTRILVMFADQAARAIENAKLYQKTDENLQNRISELSLMREIDLAIIDNKKMSQISTILIAGMERVFPGYGFAMDLSKFEEELFKSNSTFDNINLDKEYFQKLNEQVLSDGVNIDEIYTRNAFFAKVYGFPINYQDEVVGSFWILSIDLQNSDEDLVDFTRWVLSQVSMAIEKRKTLAQLIHAEKMNVMGTMLSGITHELNNPLSRILGVAEMARETRSLDEIDNHLEIIRKESLRSKRIMEDFLAFARKYKSDKTPNPINKVIEDTIQLWNYQKKTEEVELTTDLEKDLYASINVNRVQQVFLNMIVNAYHAMTTTDRKNKLKISTRKAGDDMVRVIFEDNGPGIKKEVINKIFQPFFTTKEKGKGTGLGLSLSRDIIKEHDGEIQVESELGKGTRFIIDLPACKPAQKDEEEKKKEKQAVKKEGICVLMAEDDKLIQKFVTTFLKKSGYKIETVTNGRLCLEKLEQKDYDVIVSDMVMPDLRGDQMIDILKADNPDLLKKLILCTGDVLDKERLGDFESFGIHVMYKPFELVELKKLIEEKLAVIGNS